MLDKIREGSQGTIAKGILGFVVLTFAVSGVSSYFSSSASDSVAVVNGEKITRSKFEQQFQNARNRMQQQYGEMFDTLAADKNYMNNLRLQVVNSLVDETLFTQHAKDLQMAVSEQAIKEFISKMTQFQTDGKFDQNLYEAVLRQNNLTADQLAEMVRNDLQKNQYLVGMSLSEFALPGEMATLVTLQQQTRDFDYIAIKAADFAGKVDKSEQKLQDYYQLNQAKYETPEQLALQYVELKGADLAAGITVTDADAQAFYDANLTRYKSEESRRVSHILLESAEDNAEIKAKAEALLAELKQGADFAALAKANSADTFSAENGGDLEFVAPGKFEPEFEKAAYELAKVGDVSAVVKTSFGYHIIKLTELTAPQQKPFDAVKVEIITALKAEKSHEKFMDLQQKLGEVAFEVADSLEEAAKAVGVTVKTTPLFTRNNPPAEINQPKLLDAVFNESFVDSTTNSEVIDLGNNHVVVARIAEHKKAQVRPFADVKADVEAAYVVEQSAILAEAAATSVQSDLQSGKSLQDVAVAGGYTVQQQKAQARFSGELDANIRSKVFEMPHPADKPSIAVVRQANGDSAVIALQKVTEVPPAKEATDEELYALAQQLGQVRYQAVMKSLREQAKIEMMPMTETPTE